MHASFRRLFALIAVALTLALAACTGGGGQGSTPPATAEPVAAAPTRTPRPTREPTAEPEPTEEAEPTAEPEPTAAAVTSEGELAAVEFGDLETYEHPSGVFQIDMPSNWELQDNSKPDEIIMLWTDPTQNGGVIVNLFEVEPTYTADQLTDILTEYLNNQFGSEENFSTDEPETQGDDSILITWSYTGSAGDLAVDYTGNSFIEQRGNKISLLTALLPSEQLDATLDPTNEIINTYRINPDAVLTTAAGGDSGLTTGGDSGVTTGAEGLPATIVAVGDSFEAGSGLTMTVLSLEEPAADDFLKPDEGNKFVIVRAVVENSGGEAQPVSSLLQMSLYDGAGNKYDLDILAATLAEQTLDGEVPAGGSLEGGVGFQIPVDASGLVFVFNPLIDGEPVGVALD